MSLQIEFGRMTYAGRKKIDKTQEYISERADMSTRYLHNVEYGESEPGLRVAVTLAVLLDLDLNELKKFVICDEKGFYRKEYDQHGTVNTDKD